jgi:small subunit ribosomal protein S18
MEETKSTPPPAVPAAPSPRPAQSEGPRGPRPERTERNGQRRGRFSGPRPPRFCPFCAQKVKYIDYKTADQLRRYLTDKGKIKARRKIGTCAKHQRRLALAIKRARHVALLPFSTESTRGE